MFCLVGSRQKKRMGREDAKQKPEATADAENAPYISVFFFQKREPSTALVFDSGIEKGVRQK